MEILITTLFVPLIGAVLLIAEWQSRTAFGRTTRANWRRGLRYGAIALVPVAAGMIWHAVGRLMTNTLIDQLVPSVARFLMIIAACRGAYRAWQVGLMPDYYTAKPADMLRQTRPRDELRLCGWILTGFPLLWAAVPALLLAAPLLFGVALVRMNSRIERTRFLWTMAIAIEHDMNLADEIDGFAGGARWRTRERYMALAGRLRDGARLSDALSSDGQLASPEVISAVRVAEQTGALAPTLHAAAVRNQQALCGAQGDGSVFTMICYCWVVLVVLISVSSSLSYWIAPKLEEIFKDFGIEMPPLTERVFDMSAGSPLFLLLVVPLLVIPAAFLLLLSTRSIDDGSAVIWGPLSWIFPRRDAPGVLRWLALAVGAQQPLPAIITDVAERIPNRNLGVRLLRAVQSIEAGGEPWESLSRENFLSRREVAAVQAAERAGSAPLALNAIADAIERARMQRILWWIEWLRPTVMIIFGLLVAVYCVAYFLPLVTMIMKNIEP